MRRPMCYLAALFLLCLIVLMHVFHVIPEDYDRIPDLPDTEKVMVHGTVSNVRVKDDQVICTLSHVFPAEPDGSFKQNGRYGMLVYLSTAGEEAGDLPAVSDEIVVSGTFHKFDRAQNEGQFDQRAYYFYKGIDGRIFDAKVLYRKSHVLSLKKPLYRLRDAVKDVYMRHLNETDAGILCALILGDKTTLDTDIRRLYRDAGIAHILSLSGLHVAAFGLAFLKGSKRLCAKIFERRHEKQAPLFAVILAGFLLLCFCVMTGSAVSTIRAFIMFLLCAICDLKGRSYDLLSAASFASLVAGILNPLSLYEAAFQLSFLAVISIGVLFPCLTRVFLVKNRIFEAILLSVAIQLGTLPVVAWHFSQVPLLGILLNLFVVPLMSLVLMLGSLLAVLGLSAGIPALGLLDRIAHLYGFITHGILKCYEWSAGIATSLPGSLWIIGKPEMWQIILYYVLIAVVTLWMEKILDRRRVVEIDLGGRYYIVQKLKKSRFSKIAIFTLFATIACVTLSLKSTSSLSIRNLSVGQGDCSLVNNRTSVILIDCGSTTENEVGKYILVPCLKANGISFIDDVFISHFDLDHCNGILELLQDPVYQKRIGRIVISEKAAHFDGETEAFSELIRLTEKLAIPVFIMHAGDVLKEGSLSFACLSPDVDAVYEDTNDASLVLRLTDEKIGYRALFTGDIGEKSEEKMLILWERSPEMLSCDYLKVAHHGSGSSSTAAFLDAAFAQKKYTPLAVISVGYGNRYAHPHADTLDRLHHSGNPLILRTDLDGETILSVSDSGVFVRTFLQ